MKPLLLGLFAVLLGASPARAHSSAAISDSSAALAFVAAFYRWYAPVANRDSDGPAFFVALRDRRAAFTPALYRALKADAVAQDKAVGESVGLDFDPFLYSQDPCERYTPIRAVRVRGGFRITVAAICNGRPSAEASVLADVVPQNGSWAFSNFADHAGRDDLQTTLRILANERRKS